MTKNLIKVSLPDEIEKLTVGELMDHPDTTVIKKKQIYYKTSF